MCKVDKRFNKTALLFEVALGIDADPLMRLQVKYSMQIARKDIFLVLSSNHHSINLYSTIIGKNIFEGYVFLCFYSDSIQQGLQ